VKLKDIIAIADRAYPGGLSNCARDGDILAKFIKRELKETYSEQGTSVFQINQATQALELAQIELISVINALTKAGRSEA
jgi:hypothetical protein